MIAGFSKDKIQIMQYTATLPVDYPLDKITPGCALRMMHYKDYPVKVMPYKMFAVEDYDDDFDAMKEDADRYFQGLVLRGEIFTVFTPYKDKNMSSYTETIMTRHILGKAPVVLRATNPGIDIIGPDHDLKGTYHTMEEARDAVRRHPGSKVHFPSVFDREIRENYM